MGEGEGKTRRLTLARLKQIAFGWLQMSSREYYETTPADLMLRLDGWQEIRDADNLEDWRRARAIAGYVLAIGQWKKGKEPDILKLMPLPGDEKPAPVDNRSIEEIEQENAERLFKMAKAWNVKLSEKKIEYIIKYVGKEAEEHFKKS